MAPAFRTGQLYGGQVRARGLLGITCYGKEEGPVDDLGISTRELRALLRISNRSTPDKEHGERLDDVIAAVHGLLPFTHCVVLHERLHQSHTLAFVYQHAGGFGKRIGATRQGDPPLQISHYLQCFSRFGVFQNAFFWFHRESLAKEQSTLQDRGVAEALWNAEWSEGIAGGINVCGTQGEAATLVLLQYSQEQFAAKHLVFANLIAGCLHNYFLTGEAVTTKMLRAIPAGWMCNETLCCQLGADARAGRAH
jgi:hypothetical protein